MRKNMSKFVYLLAQNIFVFVFIQTPVNWSINTES